MIKTYIIKCNTHFPGYELLFANSIEEAIKESKQFNCDYEGTVVRDWTKILSKEYEDEYKTKNSKKWKAWITLGL